MVIEAHQGTQIETCPRPCCSSRAGQLLDLALAANLRMEGCKHLLRALLISVLYIALHTPAGRLCSDALLEDRGGVLST